MRIGLARRGYSASGGAEQYLLRLAAELGARGHECVLFADKRWPADRWPDGEIVRVDGRDPLHFSRSLAALEPRRHCDLLFSLERILDCDCYRAGDGVHRAWLDRRARLDGFGWWRMAQRKHRILLDLEKSLFAKRRAGQVIANSRMVRDEIIAIYGYPAERVSVVYNGLPTGQFAPPTPEQRVEARARYGLKEDDYAMLFAGTGWRRKGLDYLLRAVSLLPQSVRPVLLVAGRGGPRALLRGISDEGKRRMRFLGPVAGMAACYAAADVFALPTIYDPFSNACLEALATGLPVITSHANGFAEILEAGREGETLAAPEDTAALTAALLAWADPSRRAAAQPVCAAKAAAYTIEANVEQTLRVFGGGSPGQAGFGGVMPAPAG